MPLEAAELPGSVCTSAAATPLQFQDLRAPVTSVQPSSPVTAQYPTALSKEARKINSFSFLAQTACQHLSQSRTPPHQMPTARRTELSWLPRGTSGNTAAAVSPVLLSNNLRSQGKEGHKDTYVLVIEPRQLIFRFSHKNLVLQSRIWNRVSG